jgi:hypothetical protein
MAEYLGYQGRPEGVDWAGIADRAITGLEVIKKDREAQRAALEKSADDLVSASKEYKPGQSGSFNNLILSGADRVRTNTLDLKKELMAGRITPTEYKTRVGRMSEDWKYLGDYAKSYNDIVNKQVEYLNDPKASALGEYFLQKQANLADVANKQLVVDPNTNGILMTDPNTGMVVDFKSLLIPENQTPEKVDLLGQVAGFTKNLGAVTGYDKGFWTKSAQLNPAYTKAKQNFASSLLKNPRSAASILSDYVGDYEFYETEQQKKNIPAGKGIQLVMGPNGIATPKLTPEQLKAAQAVIERQVDAEVEKLREQPEPIRAASSSGGDGGSGGAKTPNLIMDYASFAAQDPVFANAILKSRAIPGEPNSFVEKVERGSDGKYRFYTYGYSEPTEKQKAKGERPKPSKAVVTRTVNASQVRSVFADILAKSQSVDKNEAWNQGILPQDYNQSYVRGGQSYRPVQSTSSSAISGGNVR